MDVEFCNMFFAHLLRYHMIFFILHFVNIMYHADWFADVGPGLYPWIKFHLIKGVWSFWCIIKFALLISFAKFALAI